jgi:hypothetical protein
MRQYITRFLLENGFAPTSHQIANELCLSYSQCITRLRSLADKHAIVLHPPHNSEIWVAHPFTNSPSPVWVGMLASNSNIENDATDAAYRQLPPRGWYAPCLWCAMGVAALVIKHYDSGVSILTRYGGETEIFQLDITRDGKLSRSDFIVHMALPVSKLWHNVINACNLMLPHKRQSDLDAWCQRHAIHRGAALNADKCWELSYKWYGIYLDDNWNRMTTDQVREFFNSIGLDLEFRKIGTGS